MTLTVLLFGFFQSSRQVPSDFDLEKLGRIPRILGFFMKLFPRIIVLLHYIILLILFIFMTQISSGTCTISVTQADADIPLDLTQTFTWKQTSMQTEAIILLILCAFLWFIMHIGGSIARSVINVEPYMASPVEAAEGGSCMRTLCVTCGP